LPALPTAGRLRQASGATRRACPACPESVEGSVVEGLVLSVVEGLVLSVVEGHRLRNAAPSVGASLDTTRSTSPPTTPSNPAPSTNLLSKPKVQPAGRPKTSAISLLFWTPRLWGCIMRVQRQLCIL
jgi:hypothetical protein